MLYGAANSPNSFCCKGSGAFVRGAVLPSHHRPALTRSPKHGKTQSVGTGVSKNIKQHQVFATSARCPFEKDKNNGPENRDFRRFLKQQFLCWPAVGAKKSFYHQTNVRNVFRNIEMPLGYNIMIIEDDLGFSYPDAQKKCAKVHKNVTFLGGVSKNCL